MPSFGCVANEAVRAGTVTAQPAPQTRPGQFRECVSYGLNDEGELADLGAEAKSIAGWTPVGGTSYGVVLCR